MLLYSTLTDDELLSAVRQSDEKAFAEFFRRHWKKVYAMTHSRVRSKEATQEIIQDLFISVWEKRESLSINNIQSYLYVAVKNRVLNYIDSQQVRQNHWNYYKQFLPMQDDATENNVSFNELIGVIEHGIGNLPEKSRKVFTLNRLEGRSIKEIAGLLNLSEKAIEYHITQSVKKLRLHLKDYMALAVTILSGL